MEVEDSESKEEKIMRKQEMLKKEIDLINEEELDEGADVPIII
jgi:hypothetical protein